MVGFARIDVVGLAVALGTIFAVGTFLMTATLLMKDVPPGVNVGAHLSLLNAYFPGYSVSWGGGIIGAVYAWVIGALIGSVWAALWNLTHYVYIGLVVIRAHWWRMMDD